MSTLHLLPGIENDMRKNAERVAIKSYKGEVATARTFVKPGVYTASELQTRWRKTIWDTVPSLMAGERRVKCF